MSRIIIVSAACAVTGLVFGLNMQQSPPEGSIPPTSELTGKPTNTQTDKMLRDLLESNRNLQARITTLETQQTDERTSRLSLSTDIESLKKELAQKSQLTFVAPPTGKGVTAIKPEVIPGTEGFADDKTQVLMSLGIDANVTERIQQREEKLEMDRLYLRNTAVREGWFGTEKYFEKTQGLSITTNVYREELGDHNYDRYLFDSNQTNRISVLSVISSSPAESVGIQKGDIISQYDNEAIFSWTDLTRATTDGEAGQQVSIIVQRNEQQIELFVPRGPLGIRLQNIKVNPNS